MSRHSFLAFDLGAESGRAVVGHLESGRLTLEETHRFANTPVRMNGHLYWNLPTLWQELKTGLRKAALETRLSGLGVDAWGVDFGLLGRNGELLGNPVCYRDSRTDGMMEAAFAAVGRDRIFQTTGIQFMRINTLYQLLAMQRGNSALLEMAQSLLFMPDLFHYLFTGQRRIELTIASTSQMYDPRRRDWAWDLLTALDIPTHILSAAAPAGTVIGSIQREVADECGVIGSIPVISSTAHDTAGAVLAVPAETGITQKPEWCYISSGTWSLMGVELPEPIINEKTFRYNYTNEAGFGGSIRFLKNIMGLWLVQECRRYWLSEGHEISYADLTRMAAEARPFIATIDPDWQPFLSPGQMPAKIEQYCRQTHQRVPSSKGEFVRVCLESLALTYRRTLQGLEDLLDGKLKVIHVVCGGCQNELLNQMTADACGVEVVAGPVEATAIGNVLGQAIAAGCLSDLAEARRIVRESFPTHRYTPRNTDQWEAVARSQPA